MANADPKRPPERPAEPPVNPAALATNRQTMSSSSSWILWLIVLLLAIGVVSYFVTQPAEGPVPADAPAVSEPAPSPAPAETPPAAGDTTKQEATPPASEGPAAPAQPQPSE